MAFGRTTVKKTRVYIETTEEKREELKKAYEEAQKNYEERKAMYPPAPMIVRALKSAVVTAGSKYYSSLPADEVKKEIKSIHDKDYYCGYETEERIKSSDDDYDYDYEAEEDRAEGIEYGTGAWYDKHCASGTLNG